MEESRRSPKKPKGPFIWKSQYASGKVRLVVVEGADGLGDPFYEVMLQWLPPMNGEQCLRPRVLKRTLPEARQWVEENHARALAQVR